MATGASFTTDPAAFGKYHPDPVTTPQDAGPGTYTLSGVRSFAITNLSGSGDVTVDGVGLPANFSYQAELLPLGQVYADVTVVVGATGQALISETT